MPRKSKAVKKKGKKAGAKKPRKKVQTGDGYLKNGLLLTGLGAGLGLGALSLGILYGGDDFNDALLKYHNRWDIEHGYTPIRPQKTTIRPSSELGWTLTRFPVR